MRDITLGETIDFKFTTTEPDTGAPATLAGTPVISAYVGNSVTQITAGITLTVDFDGVTGLHNVRVVATSGNGYTDNTDVALVITTGTVDSVSAVGYKVAEFTIGRAAAYSRLGAPAGASVSADVAAVKSDSAAILTDTADMQPKIGSPAGASVSADIAAVKAETAAIVADTGTDGVVVAAGSKTGYALSTSGNEAVADQVWDEATSGHLTSGSLGSVLAPTETGTAQAGGADTITLRSGASASNDYYNKQKLRIVAGTGAGQSEFISDYVGSTRVATMGAAWVTQPDNTSVYVIDGGGTIPGASAPTADQNAAAVWNKLLADHVASGSFGQAFSMFVKRRGTAQAGGASTITLDASASVTDNFYRYDTIAIVAGTGAGQGSRQISGYVGSSKVATVSLPWTTQPDNTSVFMISPLGVDAATVAQIAAGVWDEARSSHVNAGTFGEYTNADMLRMSGDATAADNAEAFFDGTGYAGTNNIIPSVTTVTGNVNGNVGGNVTGNVGGNVTGSVGSVVGSTAQTGDAFARLGAPAGASVSADIAAVKVDTAAILVDTGTTLDGKIDTIGTNVDSILADTGTDGVVVATASKTGYALSAAGVDAVLDEAITEPAGVFAWGSATLRNIIGWLGARASNKETQTATTLTVRNRADGATLASSTCSDDATTAVKGSFT